MVVLGASTAFRNGSDGVRGKELCFSTDRTAAEIELFAVFGVSAAFQDLHGSEDLTSQILTLFQAAATAIFWGPWVFDPATDNLTFLPATVAQALPSDRTFRSPSGRVQKFQVPGAKTGQIKRGSPHGMLTSFRFTGFPAYYQ